jgi:hypothetical protein
VPTMHSASEAQSWYVPVAQGAGAQTLAAEKPPPARAKHPQQACPLGQSPPMQRSSTPLSRYSPHEDGPEESPPDDDEALSALVPLEPSRSPTPVDSGGVPAVPGDRSPDGAPPSARVAWSLPPQPITHKARIARRSRRKPIGCTRDRSSVVALRTFVILFAVVGAYELGTRGLAFARKAPSRRAARAARQPS